MVDIRSHNEADAGRSGVTPAAARQALDWLMRMQSGDFPVQQRQAWQRWRAADPTHESAWRRIEHVNRRLQQVDSAPMALQALAASGQVRRRNLKLLAGALGITMFGFGGREAFDWRFGGDYSSGIGQVRAATLPDGTIVFLNTDSALDVIPRENGGLSLRLRRGEVMLETAENVTQDVWLDTGFGRVSAWRARFMARRLDQACMVGVFSGFVDVLPAGASTSQDSSTLPAGQQLRLERTGAVAAGKLPAHAGAWTDGMLIVVDMPLSQFLAELGRYRLGVLRCDPTIADWRISGSYPVADTDRALDALTAALPVTVARRTRYWVSVNPKGAE